jgi:outer membrane receptor protein involved in Fe transport
MMLAIQTLIVQSQAQAQAGVPVPAATVEQAPPQGDAAPTAQEKAVKSEVQQVVVTGVAGGGAKRKIDTAFSITTATEEQIKQANPSGTADLLKIVPGIYVESTAGISGANVQIRGFPSSGSMPYITMSVNGAPIFPKASLLTNDGLFKMDDTVERVEVLRGGPSSLFSNGQFGATMDWILKTGSETPEGSIRATVGTGDMKRYDFYYGGKLADGWYGTLGGFYQSTNGVRDAGFPAVVGGQLSGTLTRKLEDGSITIYARSTHEDDADYTGVPVYQNPTTHKISAYQGFDPLTATFESNLIRQIAPPGGTTDDLQRGRGVDAKLIGLDFNQKFNGWAVSDKASYLNASSPIIAVVAGNVPTTMAAFIASQITATNSKPAVVAAAGGKLATSGVATYVDNGQVVDGNQQVIENSMQIGNHDFHSFSNQIQATKEVIKDHTLTGGVYTASFTNYNRYNSGNLFLQEVANQGRPINITLNNGAVLSSGGYFSGAGQLINVNGSSDVIAGFVHDDWAVNDKLTVNYGVRTEHTRLDAAIKTAGVTNLGTNALNVYNLGLRDFSAASTATASYHDTFNVNSWELGGLYKLNRDMSVFASGSYGGTTPDSSQLRGTDPRIPPPVTHVHQYELGFKTATPFYSAYITLFQNTFSDYFLSQTTVNGVIGNTTGNTTAHGIEYELAVRPFRDFQVALSGNVQKSHYFNYDPATSPGINGNTLIRQPISQFRLTPSYNIPLDEASLRLYTTYTFVGSRYSDQQNTQILPSYNTLDAGVILAVGEKLEFRLTGTNLTNELGLTEGNVHGTNGDSVVIGRPLFGRQWQFSAMYRF